MVFDKIKDKIMWLLGISEIERFEWLVLGAWDIIYTCTTRSEKGGRDDENRPK